MRAILALTALGLGMLVLAGFGGSAAGLDEVRVCGTSGFDRGEAACRTHQRSGIRSSTIYCSARTSGHSGDMFSGRLTYRGAPFPVQTGRIASDGNIYTYLTIGGGPFPGGPWRCDVSAGSEKASVSFTTAGPSGPVTSLAACLTKNTVLAGPVRACRNDAAGTLPATDAITCSAVYNLAKGKQARVDVLFDGEPTGLTLKRKVPLPISVFGVRVSKPGGLPGGSYACVFSVDGTKAATKRFRVSG
ncbi:MAG: hypothetical protein ACXWZP_04050 [Gaiellaceae bacterium]